MVQRVGAALIDLGGLSLEQAISGVTVAQLRSIEPKATGEIAIVKEHTAGTGLGGGRFRGVMGTSPGADNNGTVIRTSGGNSWVRVNADVTNPLMFGALGDGQTSDHNAIFNAIKASGNRCEGLGRTYFINDTIYMNTIEAKRTFVDAVIRSMADLPDGRPMLRMCNNQYIKGLYMDGGTQGKKTIGILWEGGRISAPFGGIEDCEFRYIGSQAIYVGCDYDNAKFAVRGFIKNIRALQCGNRGEANGRATIVMDGVSEFHVEGIIATGCNWGIYFRNDLNLSGVTRKQNNKLLNSTFIGSGRNHATMTDAQGISASFQENLQISNVTVADFADNAIDMQYCDASIVSQWRATNCKDGVFMGDRSCRRHVITDGVAIDCDRAIRLINDGSAIYGTNVRLESIKVSNVHCFNPKDRGFQFKNTGQSVGSTLTNLQVDNCSVDAIGTWQSSQRLGMEIAGAEQVSVDNFQCLNTHLHGISVDNCNIVNLTRISGGNIGRGATAALVHVTATSHRVKVCDFNVYGSPLALWFVGGSSHSVSNARWRSVTEATPIRVDAGSVVQVDCQSY